MCGQLFYTWLNLEYELAMNFFFQSLNKHIHFGHLGNITNSKTLRFFDVNNRYMLQVNDCDLCLNGTLLEDGQAVAFTSSTMSAN